MMDDDLRNHGYLGPGGNENDPGGGDWVGGAYHDYYNHNFKSSS